MVVIPVYNEQASVRKVLREWIEEIENWSDNFVVYAINDGSKDDSLRILRAEQQRYGPRLEVVDRENRGHGQTCLDGYREAVRRGIPFVFQIDSDGQCDPQYFFRFWRVRHHYDVVYGVRVRRDDGWRRIAVSMVLRFFLLALFRTWCPDANVPYRLMRTSAVARAVDLIPSDFFLVNVALAVMLRHTSGCRHSYLGIRFRERYGGEPSVKAAVFGRKALELYRQLNFLISHVRN
jgi:dolichol-phosphate mannosyltransferase